MPTPIEQALAAYHQAAGPAGPEAPPTPTAPAPDHSAGAFFGDLWHALVGKDGGLEGQAQGTYNVAKSAVTNPVSAAAFIKSAVGGGKKTPAAKTTATDSTPALTDEQAGAQTVGEMEQQLAAADIWNQLGRSLVAAQENLVIPVEQAVSGALTAPAESTAEQTALAAIGLSPTDSAAKWLHDQIAQADTNDAPMQKAMQAYGAAFARGQTGVDAALSEMGKANQVEIATAPEADWINTLAQHVMSNVNYYGQIPDNVVGSLPPALQYYLQQSGAGGGNLAGSTSLQSLTPAGAARYAPATGKTTTGGLPKVTSGAGGSVPSVFSNEPGNAQAG